MNCSECGTTTYDCPGCDGTGVEPGTSVELTYISMVKTRDTGKTLVWDVVAQRDGAKLGEVKWFGRWRKYAFFPIDSIFEEVCLREIAAFIEGETKRHRAKKRMTV